MKIDDLFSILKGANVPFDENAFDRVLHSGTKVLIKNFYRGDTRSMAKLTVDGFKPKEIANEKDKLNFIKACCSLTRKEAIDLAVANQFRYGSEYGGFFVSTGLDTTQMHGYSYAILGLEMTFYEVVDKAGGALCIGINQNDWTKPIRAIKMNNTEVVFLDAIPAKFIKLMA